MDSRNRTCQTVVQFQCKEGYELVGNSSLTCMQNGEWDSNVPTCHGKIGFLGVMFYILTNSSTLRPQSQILYRESWTICFALSVYNSPGVIAKTVGDPLG